MTALFRRTGPAPALTLTLTLALGLTAMPGCGGPEEVRLAEVPADATEKVLKAQPKPSAREKLPPSDQQSQGRPY
jgi:hypothetical protein